MYMMVQHGIPFQADRQVDKRNKQMKTRKPTQIKHKQCQTPLIRVDARIKGRSLARFCRDKLVVQDEQGGGYVWNRVSKIRWIKLATNQSRNFATISSQESQSTIVLYHGDFRPISLL